MEKEKSSVIQREAMGKKEVSSIFWWMIQSEVLKGCSREILSQEKICWRCLKRSKKGAGSGITSQHPFSCQWTSLILMIINVNSRSQSSVTYFHFQASTGKISAILLFTVKNCSKIVIENTEIYTGFFVQFWNTTMKWQCYLIWD